MILLGLVVGAATLAAGVLAALGLRALPTVRWQLAGLALLAVALPLMAVSVSGLVMFHTGADVGVLVVSAAAALSAVAGAVVVERAIVRRLERVRAASVELAGGELTARAPVGGPAELAELASSFNAMAEELERLFDARRRLVAWASHDLRAPLASMRAVLEAIEDGVVEPEHYLQSLQSQVRLLSALVDDLFELARLDAGGLALNLEPVDLVALAAAGAVRHGAEARSRGIELRVAARDGRAMALAQRDAVDRVLTNLLVNALRFTPSGGRVTVSVGTGPGVALVTVEDTGVGIAADDLARVFEPFWRADAARTPSEGGAGLGLAIARGLIEAQGGRIWAEPPAAGGARVCFALPVASVPGPVHDVAPTGVSPAPSA